MHFVSFGLQELTAGHQPRGTNTPHATPDQIVATGVAGAEIDLLLEIPGHGPWAIEIKRGLSPKPGKGFHIACEDLKPSRRFVVYSGSSRYPISTETQAIGR